MSLYFKCRKHIEGIYTSKFDFLHIVFRGPVVSTRAGKTDIVGSSLGCDIWFLHGFLLRFTYILCSYVLLYRKKTFFFLRCGVKNVAWCGKHDFFFRRKKGTLIIKAFHFLVERLTVISLFLIIIILIFFPPTFFPYYKFCFATCRKDILYYECMRHYAFAVDPVTLNTFSLRSYFPCHKNLVCR